MNEKKVLIQLALTLLVFTLVACQAVPTSTPAPTSAPIATSTPIPTRVSSLSGRATDAATGRGIGERG